MKCKKKKNTCINLCSNLKKPKCMYMYMGVYRECTQRWFLVEFPPKEYSQTHGMQKKKKKTMHALICLQS